MKYSGKMIGTASVSRLFSKVVIAILRHVTRHESLVSCV